MLTRPIHDVRSLCVLLTMLVLAPGALGVAITGVTGSGLPVDNYQPSLAINFVVPLDGVYGRGVPLRMFAFKQRSDSPWASADGRSIPVGTGSDWLFQQIGTTYGGLYDLSGELTDFLLPDLRGRTPIGTRATGTLLGEQSGSATYTLGLGQMPPHDHALPTGARTQIVGGTQAISNRQPSLAINMLIVTSGEFPLRDQIRVVSPVSPYLAQIQFAAASAPNIPGRLLAHGQTLLLAQNTAIFSLLGVNFGGDGRNNFRLPDTSARALMGAGQGAGLSPAGVGDIVGTDAFTLNLNQLPAHRHTLVGGSFTGLSGASQTVENRQPTLAVTYAVAVDGVYPNWNSSPSDDVTYFGEIIAFAGNYAPGGFLPADGRLLQIQDYTPLFSLIGTIYGGDGRNTFALPDLRGRVPVGMSDQYPLGSVIGAERQTLGEANLPPHTHVVPACTRADIASADNSIGSDGRLTSADVVVFFQAFFAGCPSATTGACSAADITDAGGTGGPDGWLTGSDVVVFFASFFAGCGY